MKAMSDGGVFRVPRILTVGSSLVLGTTFLVAGALKAPDPRIFADQILRILALDPELAIGLHLARAAIALEVGLGVLLLLRFRLRATFALSGVLILMLMAVVLRAEAVGERACGCFGEKLKRTPQEALLEDALLLVVTTIGFASTQWLARARSRQARSQVTSSDRSQVTSGSPQVTGSARLWVAVTVAAGSLVAPFFFGPPPGRELFREGRYIGFLTDAGNGAPDLRQEELVVLIVRPDHLDDPEARVRIENLAENPIAPPTIALVSSPAAGANPPVLGPAPADLALAVPGYSISPRLLDGIQDRLPRTLFLFRGTVEKTWDGIVRGPDLECQVESRPGTGSTAASNEP